MERDMNLERSGYGKRVGVWQSLILERVSVREQVWVRKKLGFGKQICLFTENLAGRG
jgi:hypothetical protein